MVLLTLLSRDAASSARLPPEHVARLLLRVVAHDRALAQSEVDALTVVVLYRAGEAESEIERLDVEELLRRHSAGMRIRGRPLRIVSTAYADPEQLAASLADRRGAIFICRGLRDVFDSISAVSRQRHLLTVAGSADLVQRGASVGLVREGNRPAVIVNLAASKAEGAELDPDLLSLAQVIR